MFGSIYLLLNKNNGKQYVGQTTTTIASRCVSHRKDSRKLNTPLAKAIRKFGIDAFEVGCLEGCSSQEELNRREQYWIKRICCLFPKGYNLRSGGGRGKHSQVSIEKMRAVHKGSNQGRGNPFFGKKHSAKSRAKMKEFWAQNDNFNARKEFCKHGHRFDEENTRIRSNGKRQCRACVRTETRKRRLKAKSEEC